MNRPYGGEGKAKAKIPNIFGQTSDCRVFSFLMHPGADAFALQAYLSLQSKV
jgi:hypothetical protein